MTIFRFVTSRAVLAGILVSATFGASAQDAPKNPNPFQPSGTASTAASASTTPPAVAAASRSQTDVGPMMLPPPLPVPLEKLPPQLDHHYVPPKAHLPGMPPPSPAGRPSATDIVSEGPDSAAPVKPRAFLSRETIEANRARCHVSFQGRTLIHLPAEEAEQVVQAPGANGCLTAMSADAEWLDVQYTGDNEILLSATENSSDKSRRARVTVVTPKQTFVLTVRQAAAGTLPAPASATAPRAKSMPAPVSAAVTKAKPVRPLVPRPVGVAPASPKAN